MSQPFSVDEIMQRIRAQARSSPQPNSGQSNQSVPQDSAQILERIRRRLKTKQESASVATVTNPTRDNLEPTGSALLTLKLHDLDQLRKEMQVATQGHRDVGQVNPRPRGVFNAGIQLFKKTMRRSLTWYTRPIHVFQGAIIRSLQQISAILENHTNSLRSMNEVINNSAATLQRQLSANNSAVHSAIDEATRAATDEATRAATEAGQIALANQAAEFERKLKQFDSTHLQQMVELKQQIDALHAELGKTREQVRDTSLQQRLRDRDIRRMRSAIEGDPIRRPETIDTMPATPPMFPSEITGEGKFDYFAFEDRYRGSENDIGTRQKDYLDYFHNRQNVLDIGCGRGEFLELLRDHNVSARGIELGTDQYLLCKEKGLDVIQQDLFSYLESLPDESLGGIFSAQVIEHMTASDQLRYVALAYRKTTQGSPVIFETINAQCVYAVMRNFFLDPTHVRPIHPETLKFAMESTGFEKVVLRFSGPVAEKQIPALTLDGKSSQLENFNQAIKELNEFIYGYQDYAAIGWK